MSQGNEKIVTLGTGVFVIRNNKILLGKRGPNARKGAGCMALPGGMVDKDEELEIAAMREVEEETGLKVAIFHGHSSMVQGLLGTSFHKNENHVTFWMLARYLGGEAVVKEPKKCEFWNWYDMVDISKFPGVFSPGHEQHYWIPFTDWQRILKGKI